MKIGDLEVYGVIYKITNKVNGKVYIGQTINGFDKRYPGIGSDINKVYNFHKALKNSNKPSSCNIHLLKSIDKHGEKSFEVEKVYDVGNTKEELDEKEIYWIKYFDSYKNGYNRNLGGSGRLINDETRKDIRDKWLDKNGRVRIVCTTLNKIFDNHLDMIEYFNEEYKFEMKAERLFNACDNKIPYKPRKTEKKLEFDFIYAHEYFLNKIYKNKRKNTDAPVICVNDMNVFLTQNECKKYYGLTNLYDILKSRKNVNKIKSEDKLNIMRYKDYINTVNFKEIEKIYESITDK